MMIAFNFNTFFIFILFLIDLSFASKSLVPRALHGLRHSAAQQTHSLARDLRIAFSGILASRADSNQNVVYCKPGKQVPFAAGASGNGNVTGPAGANTSGTSQRVTVTATKTGPSPTASSSPWKLISSYQGNSFFDGWDFFTDPDPTEGIVQYIDQNTAVTSGLLEINSQGNAVMRVETTPVVSGNRRSIRITTQTQFTGGLVVMDSVHIPTGCGTWPAFWTNGPDWPAGGEIDIVEGVGDYTNDQATIHTNVGCTLSSSTPSVLDISGSIVGGTNCAAQTTGNQGCGIRAATNNSFGSGFNSNGGGVYAMKWDSTGIAVYFFPRGSEPGDITARAPQPDSWGAALARWPAASCDPFKFFTNHSAIFDTTLCGQWAGAVWDTAGIPGQEQSCAQRTGVSTCEAFVRANGAAMQEAYWEVKSVMIYQL
ncbi:concanavalin A-like lectin/glucanase domain-containing protein [Gymnopilus junonius]|uniref:Concanavalin A-like lectin/glucanase domain-containing protein n=1 Tax=Gymnopilus junonius TaxID=109634 RepID=A0A9P5P277_GYMJU|nr:concanavalin A-like lectin/glucanase domain-containing protein [Gymnopilus junonius]